MEQYIPWSISFVSLLFVIFNFVKAGKKDVQENDLRLGTIKESLLKANMKLDQVCSTTNETRTDIKTLNNDIRSIDKRVVILERDLKTAFKKLDELSGGKLNEED